MPFVMSCSPFLDHSVSLRWDVVGIVMLLVRLLVEMVWMLLLLKAVRIVLFDSIVWQVPPRLFVQFDWWLVVEDISGAILWIDCC